MFEGDVEAGKMHMLPMHALLCGKVVLSPDRRRLDSLPPPSRLALLSVVAMYLPYYAPQVHPTPPSLSDRQSLPAHNLWCHPVLVMLHTLLPRLDCIIRCLK